MLVAKKLAAYTTKHARTHAHTIGLYIYTWYIRIGHIFTKLPSNGNEAVGEYLKSKTLISFHLLLM